MPGFKASPTSVNPHTAPFGRVISPARVRSVKVTGLMKTNGGAPPSGARTLIAYGTRYGATEGTSQEIARILREEGHEVKVANLKQEKVEDLSGYNLIVVGSGIPMGTWAAEADDFLRRHREELNRKKLALFVSTMKTMAEREGKTEQVASTRKKALDDKAAQHGLRPIALGLFGGVIDFNRMGLMTRMAMGLARPALEKDGFKETPPGVYDLRDWDEIRSWARELTKTARQA